MKSSLILGAFTFLAIPAQATVHTVTCQDAQYHFLPVTVNAFVGDTIHWTWVSGVHIVGPILETDIPEGADFWYGLITSAYPSFEYVVAYAGDYHYVCHPQTPHDENGYISVSVATDATAEPSSLRCATLFPNPTTGPFSVASPGADAMVIHAPCGDVVGSQAYGTDVPMMNADAGTLPKGTYIVSLLRKGATVGSVQLIKQ